MGSVTSGKCRLLPVDAVLDEGEVFSFPLDADNVEPFLDGGFDGGA